MQTLSPPSGSPPSSPPPAPRRLYRYPDDGMVGGVAHGLGVYLGVDPVLVRVGFVLLTITGGVALPLYAVLWLVVPRADQPASSAPSRTPSSGSARFWVGLCLVALGAVALADAFDGPGNLLAAFALIGIGVALFTMDRPPGGDQAPGAGSAVAPAAAGRGDVADAADPVVGPEALADGADGVAGPPTPGAPTPAPVAPLTPARRERSILGRLTVAALLLWAGAALLLVEVTTIEISAVTGLAVALLIVALALLTGAWFGRARWLIVIGVLLLPAIGVAALFDEFDLPLRGPVGEADFEVTDDFSYHHLAGEVELDLRRVEVRDGDTITAQVTLTFGELIIRLPQDVRVELDLGATAGEFTPVGGQDVGGTRIDGRLVYNADATGGTVVVDARVGFGEISIRGDATLDEQSSRGDLEVRS